MPSLRLVSVRGSCRGDVGWLVFVQNFLVSAQTTLLLSAFLPHDSRFFMVAQTSDNKEKKDRVKNMDCLDCRKQV